MSFSKPAKPFLIFWDKEEICSVASEIKTHEYYSTVLGQFGDIAYEKESITLHRDKIDRFPQSVPPEVYAFPVDIIMVLMLLLLLFSATATTTTSTTTTITTTTRID
uniref:Uncharacterized protein n=1 Tax=Glossina brevipalpis TaxID=37001 RepID=A0A1A9X4Q2_9MUSC